MLVKEINRLHKYGVLTDEMFSELERGFRDDGRFIGLVPKFVNSIYSLKFNPYVENFNIRDVFNQLCSPWLGADDDMPELFGKYGYSYYGISDGFDWFHEGKMTDYAIRNGYKPIEQATEIELWKMIALSNIYWYNFYAELYNKASAKADKLQQEVDNLRNSLYR